ncbi:DNA polymerase III subunit beta [Paenibacillus pinihumi]|uniref:DNA polymerase III subunit beta n=1 Tax=Paenibacillus pinihumi TaxID=669462 RepID=UPI000412A974|nr:DNA polymerase III subunit beta [Paenibacillus pinihumi]
MLIHITKRQLMDALQHVLKAVTANCLVPILSGIRLHASRHELVFTASNTSLLIEYRVPVESEMLSISRTGSVVVAARYFHEVIRRLDDGQIILDLKPDFTVMIQSGSTRIRLCGMNAAEFPAAVQGQRKVASRVRVKTSLLKTAIQAVAPAASLSGSRPVLTGVFIEIRNHSLKLIATDGVRLASHCLPVHHHDEGTESCRMAIIPAKNLQETARMLADGEGTTELEISANQIRLTAGSLLIESAVVEGVYPAVQHVIPSAYLTEITLEHSRFLRAVERATVLGGGKVIRLTAATDQLALLSRTAEIGDLLDEIPIAGLQGEPFALAVNGEFLTNILRAIDSGNVVLRYTGESKPMVILPGDAAAGGLYILTPIRTAAGSAYIS